MWTIGIANQTELELYAFGLGYTDEFFKLNLSH